METGICLFLERENGIWALGLGIPNTKLEMGNMSIHYTAYKVNAQ